MRHASTDAREDGRLGSVSCSQTVASARGGSEEASLRAAGPGKDPGAGEARKGVTKTGAASDALQPHPKTKNKPKLAKRVSRVP